MNENVNFPFIISDIATYEMSRQGDRCRGESYEHPFCSRFLNLNDVVFYSSDYGITGQFSLLCCNVRLFFNFFVPCFWCGEKLEYRIQWLPLL